MFFKSNKNFPFGKTLSVSVADGLLFATLHMTTN